MCGRRNFTAPLGGRVRLAGGSQTSLFLTYQYHYEDIEKFCLFG